MLSSEFQWLSCGFCDRVWVWIIKHLFPHPQDSAQIGPLLFALFGIFLAQTDLVPYWITRTNINSHWRFMEFVSCVQDAEKLKGKVRGSGGMPVLLAIGVFVHWLLLIIPIVLRWPSRGCSFVPQFSFRSFTYVMNDIFLSQNCCCSSSRIGTISKAFTSFSAHSQQLATVLLGWFPTHQMILGDVTPTNSEDMFIMFGFIIVGLSLASFSSPSQIDAAQVSMCINVIQLKLEELFEELLLTMMEEYGDTGQTVEEITAAIKPRMSLVDLWKVWKRRRQRRSMQIQSGKWGRYGEGFVNWTTKIQRRCQCHHRMVLNWSSCCCNRQMQDNNGQIPFPRAIFGVSSNSFHLEECAERPFCGSCSSDSIRHFPIIHQIKHNLAFKSNSNGFMLHAWFPLSSGLEFAQLHNQGVGWRSWPIGGFFKNHLNIRRHWPTIHLKFPQMPVAVNRNSPREGPLVMV